MREVLEDKGLSKTEVESKVDQQREKLLSSTSLKSEPLDQPSTSNRSVTYEIICDNSRPLPYTSELPSFLSELWKHLGLAFTLWSDLQRRKGKRCCSRCLSQALHCPAKLSSTKEIDNLTAFRFGRQSSEWCGSNELINCRDSERVNLDGDKQPHKKKAIKESSKNPHSKSPKRDHSRDNPRGKKDSSKVKDREKNKEKSQDRARDKDKISSRRRGKSRSRSPPPHRHSRYCFFRMDWALQACLTSVWWTSAAKCCKSSVSHLLQGVAQARWGLYHSPYEVNNYQIEWQLQSHIVILYALCYA